MDRRIFLGTVAASVLAAAGALVIGDEVGRGALTAALPPAPTNRSHFVRRAVPDVIPAAQDLPPHFFPPTLTKHPLPSGSITGLPGSGNYVALTVDDGTSSEVVRLYTEFAQKTGMRLTFFLNGVNASWTDNAPALRPLVESGQVQLGNHTWSHPDLTKLSAGEIADQLSRNEAFIKNTYGVSAKPYFRPPFGFINGTVSAVARDLGYTAPVLWYGTLSDSGLITDDQLKDFATQWMLPQHIVIGHANFLTVTECFDFLADLIAQRQLIPVTLNDYFG